MGMAHALFSASGSDRWSKCPGSLAMCKGIADTSNEASREGTAGHEVADDCLTNGGDPYDHVGRVIKVDGSPGDAQKVYEVEVTEDLADAVKTYVEYVRGFSGTRLSETRINYSELLGVETEEGFGTTDSIVLQGTVLHVFDLKLGRGFVDSELNSQMMLYAAGVVRALLDIGEEVTEVVMHIVQPRVSETPKPFRMTVDELFEQINRLKARAQIATESLFSFTNYDDDLWLSMYVSPGDKQCKYCPAAAYCRPLRLMVADQVDSEFSEMTAQDFMTDGEVAQGLAMLPLLEIYSKAIMAEANRRITMGGKVPGWKLVKGREGNRKWGDPDHAEQAIIGNLGGEDAAKEIIYSEPELLTPPKLEAALKKQGFKKKDIEGMITPLIVRNPARPTLAPESDPREPWSDAAGVDEFGVVE